MTYYIYIYIYILGFRRHQKDKTKNNTLIKRNHIFVAVFVFVGFFVLFFFFFFFFLENSAITNTLTSFEHSKCNQVVNLSKQATSWLSVFIGRCQNEDSCDVVSRVASDGGLGSDGKRLSGWIGVWRRGCLILGNFLISHKIGGKPQRDVASNSTSFRHGNFISDIYKKKKLRTSPFPKCGHNKQDYLTSLRLL